MKGGNKFIEKGREKEREKENWKLGKKEGE
jgi:hypothetical protein